MLQANCIRSKTLRDGFQQWRILQYELDVMAYLQRHECPICAMQQLFGAVDGNMKLYVFDRKSAKSAKPYHDGSTTGSIFLDDGYGFLLLLYCVSLE
jgi:hypothetical protein